MSNYVSEYVFTCMCVVVCCREKVVLLESLESQMKLEHRTRVESDAQVRELEAKHAESQRKSQQIIGGLKTQVAEQTRMRVCPAGVIAQGFCTVVIHIICIISMGYDSCLFLS